MIYENKFLPYQRNNVNHFNYYYFTNAFTNDELTKIIEFGDSLPKQKGSVVGDNAESTNLTEYRVSDVSWIQRDDDSNWIYERIADLSVKANKEMWNFDIWDFQDQLQYTMYYGNGGHYDWHADMGPGISNRKLSVVLQLSDSSEYEGGDLQMNTGGTILSVPREKGLICFFPSFLLHRVTPLSSGFRRSLVTWLCGANFR